LRVERSRVFCSVLSFYDTQQCAVRLQRTAATMDRC
jgi:hypothetical protein